MLFEPAPAITGILFLAWSITISITLQCSSWESVADSPVVPHGTIASVPSAIWNSTSSLNAFSSTSLFLNGVKLSFNLKDGIYKIYSNQQFIGIGVVKDKLLKRDIVIN